MDNIFMIHLDDYIRHIDDKLTLYAMLHQMEAAVGKLPECRATTDVRSQMAAFSPRIKELWESWNIPKRYLVSGELNDLADVMNEELMEPEDAGYYSEGSDIYAGEESKTQPAAGLAGHEILLAMLGTADKLYDDYAALMALVQKQLRLCEQ